MPPGIRSGQAGGSVPLLGESEIRLQSTGYDLVTLTGGSTMDSNYLVVRSYVPEGSSLESTELLVISSAGMLGPYRRAYEAISTASTAATIGSTCYGKIIKWGGQSSGATITLPQPASGAEFTVIMAAGASAATLFNTSVADKIYVMGGVHDGFTAGASVAEEDGLVVDFISDGTYWYPNVRFAGSTTSVTVTATS